MNTGRSIVEVSKEVMRQRETRKDYTAPQGLVSMIVGLRDDNEPRLPMISGLNGVPMLIADTAHGQLASDLGIPKPYYDRMRSQDPGLLAENVNVWLTKDPGRKRLVRTLDGRMRAWLSDKYRTLDNLELVGAVIPAIEGVRAELVSCEITERRLYIKAILPSLNALVPGSRRVGDVVEAGLCASNSEIGDGSVRIEPYLRFLACMNGMVINDSKIKKYHIGKGADSDGVRELMSNEALSADDRAFWFKVRDVARAAFDGVAFRRIVDKLGESTEQKIESNKVEVVAQVTAKKYGFAEEIGERILRHLIEGSDMTRFGLSQAVTACANTEGNYEVATALERAGGEIIEMSQREWWPISNAAKVIA